MTETVFTLLGLNSGRDMGYLHTETGVPDSLRPFVTFTAPDGKQCTGVVSATHDRSVIMVPESQQAVFESLNGWAPA